MKKKQEIPKDTKRKNLTFFLLMYPSVILAIIPDEINGKPLYSLVFTILILSFQYIVAKNFVESVYD
jgi:hypothetical protein